MARIGKDQIRNQYEIAGQKIIDARGSDPIIGRDDAKKLQPSGRQIEPSTELEKAQAALDEKQAKLAGVMFRWTDNADAAKGARVTKADVDEMLEPGGRVDVTVKKWDKNNNGYSDAEAHAKNGPFSLALAYEAAKLQQEVTKLSAVATDRNPIEFSEQRC